MESMPADLQRYYNVLLSENEFYSCGTERAVADVSVQANSNVGVGQRTASESNAGVEENIVSPLQPEGGNEVVTESKKRSNPISGASNKILVQSTTPTRDGRVMLKLPMWCNRSNSNC